MRFRNWHAPYILLSLALLLVSAAQVPVLAQGGTVVKVTPPSSSITVGQSMDVSITIENVTGLFGYECLVTFDPNVLEVVDANPDKDGIQVKTGDFLSPDFEAVNVVNNGSINYALTQVLPHEPVNGNGTLFTITFKGKANGNSAISLNSVLLADKNSSGISSTSQNGSIVVSGAPVDPTDTPPPTFTPPPDTPTPTPAEPTPTPTGPTPTPTPYVPPTPTPTPTPYVPPTATPYVPGPGVNCGQIQGYHVVKAGETLYAIGRAYTTRPQAIAVCNNLLNPNNIHRGNRLAIPVAPWVPVPPGPTAIRQFPAGGQPGQPTPPPTTGCRYTHVVQPGETLSLISWRYGVSVWSIARANNIYNLNIIYAGRALCIP